MAKYLYLNSRDEFFQDRHIYDCLIMNRTVIIPISIFPIRLSEFSA